MIARRPLLALILTALVVPATPPAAAKKPVAFPGGTWHGRAFFGGTWSYKDFFAGGDGTMTFDLTVKKGKVTGGVLTIKGRSVGEDKDARGDIRWVGKPGLAGTAGRVVFAGPIHATGTVTTQGFELPVDLTLPVEGGFSPESVTCNQVTGDILSETRAAAQAAGLTADFAAKFIALREGSSAKVEAILKAYQKFIDEALALYQQASTTTDLQKKADLVREANELVAYAEQSINAEIAKLGPCDLPPGFQPGAPLSLIAQMFQKFLEAQLEGKTKVPTLLELLALGLRTGAAGHGLAGSGPTQKTAGELADRMEASLAEGLAGADESTTVDLLVQAQMYGLDELADEARAVLGAG